MTAIWMVLFLAMVFSILLTPFAMRLSHKLGAIDAPNTRSVHVTPTPRLGGVSIGLSLVFALVFFISLDQFSIGFFAGLLIIALTGLLDDIKTLSHRFKFTGEILAAVAFISISGSELSGVGDILGFGDISFGPLSFVITVFAFVGLINAMNFSDGLDGLAGGLAVIALLFFAILAFKSGHHDVLLIALAMAGSLIGFLMYNGFPARLFMGDVGSLMIGYICATLAVHLVDHSGSGMRIQPISIALVLAMPLLDTLIVMGKRMINGDSPFLPDNTHLHHRLINMGLNQNHAVSFLYVLMFIYGFLALLGLQADAFWQFYLAIALMALVYWCIALVSDYPWPVVAVVWNLDRFAKTVEHHQRQWVAGLWNDYHQVIPNIVAILFILPLFFLEWDILGYVCLLPLSGLLLLWLFRFHNVRVDALLHGLLYLIILSMLFIYQAFLLDAWWGGYWAVLAGVSTAWIILSLFIGHMRKKLTLHSLEILLVLISWMVFFVFMPMMNGYEDLVERMRMSCIYAIPILLMGKLSLSYIQRKHDSIHVGQDEKNAGG